MSQLTLLLPETLRQQLANLAEGEGVSLNQYIVYALTRQVTLTYSVSSVPEEEIQQQRLSFTSLLQELGEASSSEIATILAEREVVSPEKELDANTTALLRQRIRNNTTEASSRTDDDY